MTTTKRKYIADLTAGEIEETLVAGARKFNAECIRLCEHPKRTEQEADA